MADVLEELTLCSGRISHYANIDVTAQFDTLGGLLVYAAEEHEQYTTLGLGLVGLGMGLGLGLGVKLLPISILRNGTPW